MINNLRTELYALAALVVVVLATVALVLSHAAVPEWFAQIAAGLVGLAGGVAMPRKANETGKVEGP